MTTLSESMTHGTRIQMFCRIGRANMENYNVLNIVGRPFYSDDFLTKENISRIIEEGVEQEAFDCSGQCRGVILVNRHCADSDEEPETIKEDNLWARRQSTRSQKDQNIPAASLSVRTMPIDIPSEPQHQSLPQQSQQTTARLSFVAETHSLPSASFSTSTLDDESQPSSALLPPQVFAPVEESVSWIQATGYSGSNIIGWNSNAELTNEPVANREALMAQVFHDNEFYTTPPHTSLGIPESQMHFQMDHSDLNFQDANLSSIPANTEVAYWDNSNNNINNVGLAITSPYSQSYPMIETNHMPKLHHTISQPQLFQGQPIGPDQQVVRHVSIPNMNMDNAPRTGSQAGASYLTTGQAYYLDTNQMMRGRISSHMSPRSHTSPSSDVEYNSKRYAELSSPQISIGPNIMSINRLKRKNKYHGMDGINGIVGEGHICAECGAMQSPEWRKGPKGPKTLCNACGLRWAKKTRKESMMGVAAAAAAVVAANVPKVFNRNEERRSSFT